MTVKLDGMVTSPNPSTFILRALEFWTPGGNPTNFTGGAIGRNPMCDPSLRWRKTSTPHSVPVKTIGTSRRWTSTALRRPR
jgi:hypothetical protein